MTNAPSINIVMPPGHDAGVIKAAKLTLLGVILAALINAFALVLGAGITAAVNWYQKAAELGWFQQGDWKRTARENGWIPRSECEWNFTQATGRDGSGKKIKVKINLLSSEYRWIYKSSAGAELGEEKIDLNSLIRGLDVSAYSHGLIAVGMASVEGDISGQSVLAEERTDKLIHIIKDELKPTIPVFGLSLGRFKDESKKSNSKATSTQRRVVVVEILEQDEGANIGDAIFDALIEAKKSSPPIPFDAENYTDRKFTERGFKRL